MASGTSLRERLRAGETVIGTLLSEVRNPVVARMLATAGMDFLIIDTEHGTASYQDVGSISAVARGAGIAPLVRIPEIRRETVLKPLDAGAAGVIVPQVETVDEVRELIRHAKYPPVGKRGTALRRGHSAYAKVSAAEYLAKANEETVMVIQAESPTAVENLDDMLSVGNVDVVFVGPFDLSVAMGIPGQVKAPALVEMVDQVVATCARHGVVAGILQNDYEGARFWLERGMRFMVYSSDVNMIVDSAAAAVEALRGRG